MKKTSLPLAAYIILETALYICFLLTDITGCYDTGTLLKYASIVLCAVFAVVNTTNKVRNSIRIASAMFLTLLADTFLLLLDMNLPGLCCFALVQTVYLFVIISDDAGLKKILITFVRRSLTAVIIFIVTAGNIMGRSVLTFVTCFYAVSFLDNIFLLSYKVISDKKRPDRAVGRNQFKPGLLLIGLILFALCDINVAIFNTSSFVQISGIIWSWLVHASDYLMWGFYLPGQVLITLSSTPFPAHSDLK